MPPLYTLLGARDDTGDAGSAQAPGVGTGDDAGASGDSSANSITISTGGLIAIIVVVIAVAIAGVATAALFMIAKRREWTIKETIRRSAKKVATALTPRRTEFPDWVKDSDSMASSKSSKRGRPQINNDVPPTPRLRPEDVEKGLADASARRMKREEARK